MNRRRFSSDPARPQPSTIFTPEGYPHWDRLVQRHLAEPHSTAYYDTRVCYDGVQRHGLWTPWSWILDPVPGSRSSMRKAETVGDAVAGLADKLRTDLSEAEQVRRAADNRQQMARDAAAMAARYSALGIEPKYAAAGVPVSPEMLAKYGKLPEGER